MSRYYRSNIQNGPVAKRPRVMRSNWPVRAWRAPRRLGPHQARALLALIGCGALVAAGFVFSLHQHFTANAIGRADARLQSRLDQTLSARRQLELQRATALSPRELARVARQQGELAPLRFDLPAALSAASAKRPPRNVSRAETPAGAPAKEAASAAPHPDSARPQIERAATGLQ
jgi:hypothetical protein